MTNALNKSIIEGRVVRIPTLKQTKAGISYCSLIVALNETYMSGGHRHHEASYITVSVWNKTAEACCRYLQKGQKVRVSGRLRQSVWTNDSGVKRSKVEINCESVEFMDKPGQKHMEQNKSFAGNNASDK